MERQVKMTKVMVRTGDQFDVAATYFRSLIPSEELVIIAPATAATQLYYKSYARFVAKEKGMNVLTFDYRGIGESLAGDIRDVDAQMSDWGFQDLKAVIDWADDRGYVIYLLGHSIAGQLFPFIGDTSKVCASYFVGSQTASSHFWEGTSRVQVVIFWRFLIPLLVRIYGYLPGWSLGAQTPLPKGVAQEWRKWGLHKDGAIQGMAELQQMYSAVQGHIHFLNITDDHFLAPKPATEQLKWRYFSAKTSMESISPEELGVKEIGHFGFFRTAFRDQLWHKPIDYFTHLTCR
ncbi:MAG: hypothetical protein AAGA85_15310 [Bacteroidota bacterium]